MAERLAAFAWSDHPLGPREAWPALLHEQVRTLLRCRAPMFVCWGPQQRLIYNDAYAEVLRDKHPGALGQPFRQVWAEVGPELDTMLAEVAAGQALQGVDTPFAVRRDGREELAWFSFVWNPVVDDQERTQGFYCIAMETTQAVHAKQAREEESGRLARLFDQAPGFLAVTSGPHHVFVQANPAYCDFVGRPSVVGRRVAEVAPEAIDQGWGEVLDRVYREGLRFVGQGEAVLLRRGDGPAEECYVDFVFEPMRCDSGQVTGILIQGHDVTEHRRLLQQLQDSEQRFRTIADAMPQMVWSTREDGFHDYYNQRWYEFTGVPEGSTDGEAWSGMFHPEDQDRAWARWRHCLVTGDTYEIEYRLRHRSGIYRWVLGRALPLRDESGQIRRWMGTCTDIHAQKLAEQALQEDQHRKDQFLALLAHELRNPLAPIASAASLLRRVAADEAQVRRLASVIDRQASHLRSLIDDLLDVSRVSQGLITLAADELDLRDVLAQAVEQTRPLLDTRRHQLLVSSAGARPAVQGDRKRLVQVFANLLANAAKYTPLDGRIAVETQVEEREVVVLVRDNGIGMDAGLLRRAFDLFEQGERTPDRSQGGLGIGLALVRRLVALHGGTVVARSEGPGRGSELEVRLPRHSALVPAAVVAEVAQPPLQALVRRVLVVSAGEDEGALLAMLLREQGHEVLVETSAGSALATAQRWRPDACLLDGQPGGLNARALADALRGLPGLDSLATAVLADDELTPGEHFDLAKPLQADALGEWLLRIPRPVVH